MLHLDGELRKEKKRNVGEKINFSCLDWNERIKERWKKMTFYNVQSHSLKKCRKRKRNCFLFVFHQFKQQGRKLVLSVFLLFPLRFSYFNWFEQILMSSRERETVFYRNFSLFFSLRMVKQVYDGHHMNILI